MADTITLSNDRFPAGTVVDAYPAASRVDGQTPVGTPVTTATVSAGGSVEFSGLARSARYVAHAIVGGEHRYVSFTTMHARSKLHVDDDGRLFDSDNEEVPVIGEPGPAGPSGSAGQDAVAISDAIRGQQDRFYREIGGWLTYDGNGFVASTDAISRPQNIELVSTDSAKITLLHEDIGARAIINAEATVGENLESVGIKALARVGTDLKTTDILLRQSRVFDDNISYNGSVWVKERSAASPFTVSFSSNVLHVTHEAFGSAKVAEIRLTPTGNLRPVIVAGSVTTTGFDVKFLDAAGAQVNVASTDMAVSVSREVRNVAVDPTNLVVNAVVQKTQPWADFVPSTTPTLWARFGEAAGTSLNDEIGTNDGTLAATVTLGATGAISGDANKAVTLDGAQGKIAFSSPGLTGPFSLSLWFKSTGGGSVTPNDYGTLIGAASNKRILIHKTSGLVLVQMGGAQLTTPAATAPNNVWHHLVFTWDGTTERLFVDGLLSTSAVSANIALNQMFWLGSYAVTSVAYSYKGDMDEFAVYNRALTTSEVQGMYVTGTDSALVVDRALGSRIGFRALFETFAPAPPVEDPGDVPPDPTPLPAGDPGGAATSYQSLYPYRSVLNSAFYDWVGRQLPVTQVARDAIELNGLTGLPNATSDNWRTWFCTYYGIDPVTGATTGNGTGGANPPLYMNISRHLIYVVGDDQPLRNLVDKDITFSGWAAQVNAAVASLGGLPIPADAFPDTTGDRYTIVYQPGTDLIATIYAHSALQEGTYDERAITTMELTAAPTGGGFFLEFDYMDNVNRNTQTFFCQTPVPYNCTAPQLMALLQTAKTTAGTVLGATRAGSNPTVVTGGPLHEAPLVIGWTLGMPLRAVPMRFTNNFMNAGAVHFIYKKAENWSRSRLSAITSPNVSNGHVPIVSGSPAVATATRIVNLPLIIDWDEHKRAYDAAIAAGDGTIAGADWDAPGTDHGHVIGLNIGNCGTGFVYPATSGDGTLSNSDGSKMKQGALCTFPIDADHSKVAPEMMPIFNTIRRYGFIPYDKTGGGSEFVFRNWTWPGQSRPFPGPSTFNTSTVARLPYMRQLPWHQIQVIAPSAVLAGW